MSVIPADNSQASDVDFGSFSAQELQSALSSGNLDALTSPPAAAGEAPAPVEPQPAAASEPAVPSVVPPDAVGVAEPAPPADAEPPAEPTAEPAIAEPAEPVAFQFTADADDETFAREREAYVAAYELDPATQYLLERQDQTIAALREQSTTGDVPAIYVQATEALDALVSRVPDPRGGPPIPNTKPLVSFLQESFPQELPELAETLLSMTSPKYQGLTLFQQYIRDYGNLDEEGLLTVQEVIDNGGRLPVPAFVPTGIDPQVTDAFWQSPNRTAIQEAIEAHYEILQDPLQTPEDKAAARQYIYQVNQSLRQVQYGIDAQTRSQNEVRQQATRTQQQILDAGDQAYMETAAALTRSFAERLAENLDMFDAPAARVTALAYGNLIMNAFADDAYSAHAQADLAKEGITFNWKEGGKALERLRQAERNIAGHVATNASPAAVEIARKEKAAALKDVKRLDLDLMGRISKIAVLGASRVLENKVATAPRTPAARPRAALGAAAGAANSVPSMANGIEAYKDMTVEELQSRIGKLKSEGGIA